MSFGHGPCRLRLRACVSDLAIRGLKVHGLGPSTSDSGFLWGLRFRVRPPASSQPLESSKYLFSDQIVKT